MKEVIACHCAIRPDLKLNLKTSIMQSMHYSSKQVRIAYFNELNLKKTGCPNRINPRDKSLSSDKYKGNQLRYPLDENLPGGRRNPLFEQLGAGRYPKVSRSKTDNYSTYPGSATFGILLELTFSCSFEVNSLLMFFFVRFSFDCCPLVITGSNLVCILFHLAI